MSTLPAPDEAPAILLQFDDNSLLAALFGEHDRNLARIEHLLGVSLSSRGNRIAIAGPEDEAEITRAALRSLYLRLEQGLEIDTAEVDAAVRMARATADRPQGGEALAPVAGDLVIRTRKRQITARSLVQAQYLAALRDHDLVFAIGPAGTGKTYLAVATAVSMLLAGAVERIILSRPAVEAGERLGFLPGDVREKVDPYLRPLYDALYDMLPGDQVIRRLANGEIEVAPLAFMRGRTLANSYIILDEAQNTTPVQMKMFLTRLGENSRMVIAGDLSQVDLPPGTLSGLRDAATKLSVVKGVTYVHFSDADVVRHQMVTQIVRAYDEHERQERRDGGPSES